jgi:hypothetical protein
MSEEKTRVEFDAPKSLVDRVETVAEVLDIPRTRLLIDALTNKLAEHANDEEFRQRLSNAYYDGRTDYDTVEAILGRKEAMRLKLLQESINRTPSPDSRMCSRVTRPSTTARSPDGRTPSRLIPMASRVPDDVGVRRCRRRYERAVESRHTGY